MNFKQQFVLAIVYVTSFTLSLSAKAESAPTNVEYSNIIKVEFLFGGIQYEHFIADRTSLGLSIHIDGFQKRDLEYHIVPEFRYYLSGNKHANGFYVAPYLYYKEYDAQKKYSFRRYVYSYTDRVNAFGFGLKGGYQLIVRKYSFEVFSGFGNNLYRTVDGDKPDYDEYQYSFLAGFSIGYLF